MSKNNQFNCLRGFQYISNLECHILYHIQNIFLQLIKNYNMELFQPPILAKTAIFQSLGDTSDIVKKELYNFTQKDGEEVCLIPECTRVFVEQMLQQQKFQGSYGCFSSCFRYERPQLGRYRHFHQISVEVIGSDHYMKDIELFCFLRDFLHILHIKDYTIWINSIGSIEDRKRYEKVLEQYFAPLLKLMSKSNQEKFHRKAFLRMLDSKQLEDINIIKNAPIILNYLCDDSKKQYELIKLTLTQLDIPFQENPFLVRGLDYYNNLVFEYTHNDLGAQNSILGGGRYDYLFYQIIQKQVPAVGFAIGIERIMHILLQNKEYLKIYQYKSISIIPVEQTEHLYALEIFYQINEKIKCTILYEGNVSNRLQKANKNNNDYVIIIGETERKHKNLKLKNMVLKEEKLLTLEELLVYF
jgi:histidyl-tRNA synthetase